MAKIKELLSIAFPIILGQFGFTLLGFIDNVMIGELGVSSLAAISLANSFIFIGLAIGIGFSIMITPLVSKSVGEEKPNKVSSLFYSGLLLCSILGVILCVFVYLSKYILLNSDQPDKVVELTIPYLKIVGLSLIPSMIFQAFKQFIDGVSMTQYPMYCIVIANLINVFLNYAMIFGEYGFPKLGIYGAGLGTFISRIIMVLLILFFALKIKSIRRHIGSIHSGCVNIRNIKNIIKVGSFSSIQILFKISLFSSTIIFSGILGTNVQAANQIILSLSGLLFVIPLGIGVASTIHISKMIGTKKYNDIGELTINSFKIILFIETIFFIILLLCRNILPLVYINDINVVQMASEGIILLAVFHFFDGIETIILGILKGFEDTKVPAIICLASYWLISFVVAFMLFESYNLKGIWVGMIVGVFISSVLLYLRYLYLYNQKIKLEIK